MVTRPDWLLLCTMCLPLYREVGQKDPGELSSDTSGTRYYAAFIVEVAQAVPGLVYPSISHLLPHLNGEVNAALWRGNML